MADQHEDVINWDEAMQQVGEDEDFLRELLNDLRGELESQVAAIAAIIQVRADERKPPNRKRIPRGNSTRGNLCSAGKCSNFFFLFLVASIS
jgi:hypothetical protein